MPRLVVDASVAIKWVNPYETLADKANLIRQGYEQGQVSLLVPTFWDYELVNGINKAIARGDLNEQEGHEAITLLLAVHAQKVPLPSPQESYALTRRYQRSVYDCWYLSLAQETGCEFWTADRRLYNAVNSQLVFVKWLGDYSEATSPPDT